MRDRDLREPVQPQSRGEDGVRTWDYEIYVPPYIACGQVRPVITSVNGGQTTIGYGQEFGVQFTIAPGSVVDKVVLMRPGAVTHGFCSDQRYLELAPGQQPRPPGEIRAKMPAGNPSTSSWAPRGWYMLFLVTSSGPPSVAAQCR